MDIISSVRQSITLVQRLREISKNITEAEFKNLLADLSSELADVIHLARILLALIAVLFPISSLAQPIEIKGLRVGMTKAEVQKKFPTFKGFTIAGVRSKHDFLPLEVSYRSGKLHNLMFIFAPANFDTVFGAIKEKYPNINCEKSLVGNPMGATFGQVECSLQDSDSVLKLVRYATDISTSVLIVSSKKLLEEQEANAKQRKKDI